MRSNIEPSSQERLFWDKRHDQHMKNIKVIHDRRSQINNIESESLKRQIDANERKAKSTLFTQRETLSKISQDNLNLMKKIQYIETRNTEQVQNSVKMITQHDDFKHEKPKPIQLISLHKQKRDEEQRGIKMENEKLIQRLIHAKSICSQFPHITHPDSKVTHQESKVTHEDEIAKRIQVLEKHLFS